MNNIYLFGDSSSQGIVLDHDRYRISRSGCVRLLKRKGLPIYNYAVHGYTVLQGLESFESLQAEPGSLCVIQFGGNDCDLDWDAVSREPGVFHDGRVPLETFRESLGRFVRKTRAALLEPVLVPPLALISTRFYRWVCRGRNADNILHYLREDTESMYRWQERYAAAVREVAANEDCRLLDVRSRMLDRFDYPSLFCEDGIHPNEEGHAVIADVIWKHLEATVF
ncbi:MAG: SGNH/GDSL hydrolase family protein [Clostridia bacterium]|nr:SGNH/GDSL hydrolase family protein [Clostridia bacterium]